MMNVSSGGLQVLLRGESVPRFLSEHNALVGAWYTTLYVPFRCSRNRAHMASSKTAVFPEPVGAETTRLSGEL